MTNPKEHLADWLRDAYAMEHQAIEMLEKQAMRIKNYPEIKNKVEAHLEQTKSQAQRLEHCLTLLGEDTSAFKTGLGKLVGSAQAFMGLFATDEIVKSCVASYVFEQYEIGNYKVLIAAAEQAGEEEIAEICQGILREEKEMSRWMRHYLPVVTQQFLSREYADLKAKV